MILRNDRGETLIEVLASVLIGTLSVALLFGCIAASSKIDTDAQALDSAYYGDLANADAQSEAIEVPPGESTPYVTIARDSVNVTPLIEIYGDNGVYSYKGK